MSICMSKYDKNIFKKSCYKIMSRLESPRVPYKRRRNRFSGSSSSRQRWTRREASKYGPPLYYSTHVTNNERQWISSSSSSSLYLTDETSSDTFYQTALNSSIAPKLNDTFTLSRRPDETYTIDFSDDFDVDDYEVVPFSRRKQVEPVYRFPPSLVSFEDEVSVVNRVTRRRNRLTQMSRLSQTTATKRRIRL